MDKLPYQPITIDQVIEKFYELINVQYPDNKYWVYCYFKPEPFGLYFVSLVYTNINGRPGNKFAGSFLVDNEELRSVLLLDSNDMAHMMHLLTWLDNWAVRIIKSIELALEQNPEYSVDETFTEAVYQRNKDAFNKIEPKPIKPKLP